MVEFRVKEPLRLSAQEFADVVEGILRQVPEVMERGVGVIVTLVSLAAEGGEERLGVHVHTQMAIPKSLLQVALENLLHTVQKLVDAGYADKGVLCGSEEVVH